MLYFPFFNRPHFSSRCSQLSSSAALPNICSSVLHISNHRVRLPSFYRRIEMFFSIFFAGHTYHRRFHHRRFRRPHQISFYVFFIIYTTISKSFFYLRVGLTSLMFSFLLQATLLIAVFTIVVFGGPIKYICFRFFFSSNRIGLNPDARVDTYLRFSFFQQAML